MPRRHTLRTAAELLRRGRIATADAAVVLAREPNSPVTRAVKLWGDDEKPFRNLIRAETAAARQWRRMMGRIIAHLEPYRADRPVYRGWNFPNAKMRAAFIAPILREQGFVNQRIGMSASRSRKISTGKAFLNRHGLIWAIRRHERARDVSAIFRAIGAKYPDQREVIFPRGCEFALAEKPRFIRVVRGGQVLRVPYLVFDEV